MTMLSRLFSIAALLLLSACGGGGGDAGTTPFTPGSGSGTPGTPGGPAGPAAPRLTVALSATTISSATPGVVTATLVDATQQPVAGQVVSFSVVRSLAQTNVATALTDAQGRAVVTLTPATAATAGADEVQASANFGGAQLTAITGFQVQSTNVTISGFTSDVQTLSAGGETTLTLNLTGASIGAPVTLTLTSSCVTQGRATLSPGSITTTNNVATVRYRDNGCGSLAQSPATTFTDQVQASVVGSTASRSLTLGVSRPDAANIAFVSASPEVIFLRGSGFVETAQVRFQVQDRNGNPLPRQNVTLTLLTAAGGLTAQDNSGNAVSANVPIVRPTDDNGFVDLRVNSGTVPTPVRVEAAVSAAVKTVSSNLSVAVGLPSQLNFSLSQGTRNIEGYNIDGTVNTYQVIAADRSGNPVPAGTSINFVSREGSQVEAIKRTELVNGIARTTANFVSSNPRPVDGRITVVAYALGEESFIDLNGNNAFDPGEPFQDLGNIYVDRNFNGTFDSALDEFITLNINNSSACVAPAAEYEAILGLNAGIPSAPGTCSGPAGGNGGWSGAGQVYVRRAIETVLSTSTARPLWGSTGGLSGTCSSQRVRLQVGSEVGQTATFVAVGGDTWYGGGSGSFTFIVADANPGRARASSQWTGPGGTFNPLADYFEFPRLNPMAAGTTITASTPTPGLTVTLAGGSPVPSTTEATTTTIVYNFTDQNVNSGIVFVSFISPGGTGTTVTVPLVRGAAPSSCTS